MLSPGLISSPAVWLHRKMAKAMHKIIFKPFSVYNVEEGNVEQVASAPCLTNQNASL